MTTQGIVGQFLSLKEEAGADLLVIQCGDFYEFFADDAEAVGRELDLKVSQESSHGSSHLMAGVPLNDLTSHSKAPVECGCQAAVANQYETESGDLRREVKRVVTPGTFLEAPRTDAQLLAAVATDGDGVDLASSDITTGQFPVTEAMTIDDAVAELYRFTPVEVLPGSELWSDDEMLSRLRGAIDAPFSLFAAEASAPGCARHTVREQFGASTVDSVGLGSDLAIRAASGILAYIEETGAGVLRSVTRLRVYHPSGLPELDATTQRNLGLTETMHDDRSGLLLDMIDHTVTSPGGRLSREWLTRP